MKRDALIIFRQINTVFLKNWNYYYRCRPCFRISPRANNLLNNFNINGYETSIPYLKCWGNSTPPLVFLIFGSFILSIVSVCDNSELKANSSISSRSNCSPISSIVLLSIASSLPPVNELQKWSYQSSAVISGWVFLFIWHVCYFVPETFWIVYYWLQPWHFMPLKRQTLIFTQNAYIVIYFQDIYANGLRLKRLKIAIWFCNFGRTNTSMTFNLES